MNLPVDPVSLLFGRLFDEVSGAYGGAIMLIGQRLGLYRALDERGPLTSAELGRVTGCNERYVREWLHASVAGGTVRYNPATGTFGLSPEQATILADETSPLFLPNVWSVVASLWADLDQTIDIFRTGRGISWGDRNTQLFCGCAAFYRTAYAANLVQAWLPALEGVVDRLSAGARVADVGCGHGHSTVLMAKAFPQSRFWGYDIHAGSIAAAQELAEHEGVADRVTFLEAPATTYKERGFDLICFFDALHDMGRPVEAAKHAREALNEHGRLMLVEPFARDRLEDNVGSIARIYYAGSAMLCCPHAMSEAGTHVLGAQAGPAQLTAILKQAGLKQVREAVTTPHNLIIEAVP